MLDADQQTKLRCCASMNIRRSARQIAQIFDHALSSAELRVTQFTTLAFVSIMGPISIHALAEQIGADRTTMTRNLAVLQKEGLIRITKNRQDTRSRDVCITPLGQQRFEAAYPLWEDAQSQITEALGETDWQALYRLITKTNAVTADMAGAYQA